MTPIRVVVIDQIQAGASDCRTWLGEDQDIYIAGSSSQLEDVDALCAAYHPDILLVSTRCLRDINSGWFAAMSRQCAATRIILFDDALTDDLLVDCLFTGARGWIEACNTPLVVKAVRAVHMGDAWVPRRLARQLVDRLVEHLRGRANNSTWRPA